MTLAVQFTSTITLGALIIAAAGGAATLAWFGYGVRWKSAWEVASTQATELRKALNDEVERSQRLEDRLHEALDVIGEQKRTIERLEALPNLERLVTLMSDTAERQDRHARERLTEALQDVRTSVGAEIAVHEALGQDRHEALIAALAGIAATMTKIAQRLERGTA